MLIAQTIQTQLQQLQLIVRIACKRITVTQILLIIMAMILTQLILMILTHQLIIHLH